MHFLFSYLMHFLSFPSNKQHYPTFHERSVPGKMLQNACLHFGLTWRFAILYHIVLKSFQRFPLKSFTECLYTVIAYHQDCLLAFLNHLLCQLTVLIRLIDGVSEHCTKTDDASNVHKNVEVIALILYQNIRLQMIRICLQGFW